MALWLFYTDALTRNHKKPHIYVPQSTSLLSCTVYASPPTVVDAVSNANIFQYHRPRSCSSHKQRCTRISRPCLGFVPLAPPSLYVQNTNPYQTSTIVPMIHIGVRRHCPPVNAQRSSISTNTSSPRRRLIGASSLSPPVRMAALCSWTSWDACCS